MRMGRHVRFWHAKTFGQLVLEFGLHLVGQFFGFEAMEECLGNIGTGPISRPRVMMHLSEQLVALVFWLVAGADLF
jgi:hypothetical protein